jgi:hypothetical protein
VAHAAAPQPAPGGGPIFIVGAMGSGTTLLRLMLDSHEHIAIPHETGFMRAYKAMKFIPFKWTGHGWAYRLGWTPEEFDAELRRFFDRIFARYADQHGARRWGEKTPLHTWHMNAIAKLFPDAVFVAIVRHPGASAASNMRRFHHGADKMAWHYERYNKEIARQSMRLRGRVVILRYEELVQEPERVMRELLEWLGEPWSDNVLQHHVVQSERGEERVEGSSRADERIDASRIGRWAETMTPADRRAIAHRLDRLAEFYGYSMDDPQSLAPLHGRESLLVRGRDIRQRSQRFADLDIPTRMPVPIFEQYYNPRRFWLVENETGEPPVTTPTVGPPPSALKRVLRPVARRIPPGTRRALGRAARRS